VNNLYWLNEDQMVRLRPYFPKSHGVPRVDDQRVLSGIILFNSKGLRWRDVPKKYGLHKTLYNRWKRWSDIGGARIMMELRRSLSQGLKRGAVSTDRRSTCIKTLCGSFVSQRHSRSFVELSCDGTQLCLTMYRPVETAGP
jgi:transposase